MANHGPSFGLSRECAMKVSLNFDRKFHPFVTFFCFHIDVDCRAQINRMFQKSSENFVKLKGELQR